MLATVHLHETEEGVGVGDRVDHRDAQADVWSVGVKPNRTLLQRHQRRCQNVAVGRRALGVHIPEHNPCRKPGGVGGMEARDWVLTARATPATPAIERQPYQSVAR